MPVGYLITVAVVGAVLLALRPLRRSGRIGKISWLFSAVPNESPFVALYWVLAVSVLALGQGDLDTPAAWTGLAFAGASFLTAPVIVRRSLQAGRTVDQALPGAQHSFDLLHSIRFQALIDGIEAFAAWVRSRGKYMADPIPWSRGSAQHGSMQYESAPRDAPVRVAGAGHDSLASRRGESAARTARARASRSSGRPGRTSSQ